MCVGRRVRIRIGLTGDSGLERDDYGMDEIIPGFFLGRKYYLELAPIQV